MSHTGSKFEILLSKFILYVKKVQKVLFRWWCNTTLSLLYYTNFITYGTLSGNFRVQKVLFFQFLSLWIQNIVYHVQSYKIAIKNLNSKRTTLKTQKWQILNFWKHQNWFHVKSEWQKNLKFPHFVVQSSKSEQSICYCQVNFLQMSLYNFQRMKLNFDHFSVLWFV